MPLPQRLPAAPLARAIALAGAIALVPQAAGQQPFTVPSSIRVGAAHGSSFEVTALPLETYVARVVAGEGDPQSSAAALEALAITVRTFAVANLARHNPDGFDVCDQTHCQVLRPSTPATERAAQATAGQVLTYRGDIASVFYSASCGGYTERPSAVWPGADDPPYLPSRKDDACEGEPAWTDDIARSDLARALGSAGFRGALRDVRVADRDTSGRVVRLSLAGMMPAEISGQDLRTAVARTLGGQHVKSAAFEVRRSGETFTFSGHGFGHGVGMCVIGSVKLAASGESARQILAHYFPGADITPPVERTTRAPMPPPQPQTTPQPAIPHPALPGARPGPSTTALAAAAVSLPAGDEGEARALETLALGARDDIARALGVPAPSRVRVTFHATTDEFERATGRAWFTGAAVVDRQIHLVPLASLRERGVLERTIRRELVHLMIDEPLAKRPAWVREGAALYFSDPRTDAAVAGRVACPSDVELLRPISPGALADAYSRARSCFARQIAAGRSWRDIR